MSHGASESTGFAKDPADLLSLATSRPKEALAQAKAVLAGTPTALEASVAYQAVGVVLRDFGDVARACRELATARRYARRSGVPGREADVLATLGVALVQAGRSRAGLSAFDAAVAQSTGVLCARILYRRGWALWSLGRHAEALDDLRRAVPTLRRAGDAIWTARALTLRALIYLALGATERASSDFLAAEELYASTAQELESIYALHNRGLVAFRAGDLPTALSILHAADLRYRVLGVPMPELVIDRCEVQLAAGLAREALQEADAGVRQLDRIQGQAARKAELYLVAARAALAGGDAETAVERAATASKLLSAQRRTWWAEHARLVLLQARFASGTVSGRLLAETSRTAERLGTLGSAESAQGHLLAGRIALALRRSADAERHLSAAARSRHRGPLSARAGGWLAEALRARANGKTATMLIACARGLDLLDEHRLTFGASELRAQATAQGAELASMAQRQCLRSGGARRLLAWSERWRATALAVPPLRPPDDHESQQDLTAFREISSRLDKSPGTQGLRREQQRLERQIRARMMRTRGTGPRNDRRFDARFDARLDARFNARFNARRLLEELGAATRLIEIVEIDGELHFLVCGDGRVRRIAGPRSDQAAVEVEYARSALRRLAYTPFTKAETLEAMGRRLECAVLGDVVRHLGEDKVVIVPPGSLHGVPWGLLPALRHRAFNVAPSATAWLRARDGVPPADGRVVLVRGPGMQSGGAELPPLAQAYAKATVLGRGTATAERVLEAIDGSLLAHIAAHGTFRADSPLFSALRLDDGPLTVHDFERLVHAPYRLVLPSCDSGRLAQVGADELLGLTAALLPLGTTGIVASLVPVNDEATVPLMLALHEALRRGATMAEALNEARNRMPDDPVHQATGSSFVALGAD